MTRDEAIEKFSHSRLHMLGDRSSGAWIEMFEALGILSIDGQEKSSPEALLCDVLFSAGLRGIQQRAVIDGLTSAGLKIVEK